MADDGRHGEPELAAGDFSAWLDDMLAAIRGEGESTVPCGGCTACCTSSQFVHIGPDESHTLAHIPTELMFPAPGLPDGHVLLGYDERGHCPMLIDNRCSIYEHRPLACRTYDCRILPAAGVELTDSRTSRIARRVRRWRFTYPSRTDTTTHAATRAAAAFLIEHRELLPASARPTTETQLAVLAVELHDLFVNRDAAADGAPLVTPSPKTVRDRIAALPGPQGPH